MKLGSLPGGASGKDPACQYRRHKKGGVCPWRRAWQTIPSILAWGIPWTEDPDGLQSMSSQRAGHH